MVILPQNFVYLSVLRPIFLMILNDYVFKHVHLHTEHLELSVIITQELVSNIVPN
jgi:hypothetical protein